MLMGRYFMKVICEFVDRLLPMDRMQLLMIGNDIAINTTSESLVFLLIKSLRMRITTYLSLLYMHVPHMNIM